MDWLYDPARNPMPQHDWLAGRMVDGRHRLGAPIRLRSCTMGDVEQTACALGAASRLDPRLSELERFYDRAEQIYSGQVVEQMFRPTSRYLAVLKDV